MANKRYNTQTSPKAEKTSTVKLTEGTPWAEAVPGDLLAIDSRERQKIETLCRRGVESWLTDAAEHHAKLRRMSDLLEGVMNTTDYPWEGASNLHIPMIAIHVVTLHSIEARSLLTVDPLWYVRTNDVDERSRAAEIESAVTYLAKSELNVIESVRDVLYTTNRDGLGWLHGWYAEETTRIDDVYEAESVAEFEKEYPDAESARMSEEEYKRVKEEISREASAENPYKVRVSYDRVDYLGPKFEVVEECNMVRAPMTAQTLKDCRVYGSRTTKRLEEIRKMARDGKLWGSAVDVWASGSVQPEGNDWTRNLESLEGVSRGSSGVSDEREIYILCVRCKMDGSDEESLLLCYYSHEKKKLLGVAKYPYRKNCFIPFRVIRRPGRMIGIGIPERLEDLNDEIDANIRYESNANAIEMAPMFTGNEAEKKDIDLDLEENWIRPGGVMWLKNPKDFKSLDIKATNKSDAKLMRQELIRYAEMYIGPTNLLSGRESPNDPDAPGNKTIALIQQSNMRIEDYINEFRLGFDEMGDFIVDVCSQYGSNEFDYVGKDGEVKSIQRKRLTTKGKMSAHGVTVNLSPEVEFAKAMQWWGILQGEPMVGGVPTRRRELLSSLMVSGRMPNRDALLPSKEEVEGELDKQRDKEAEERVMQKLIKAGVIPPPPMPGQPPIGAPGMPPAGGLPLPPPPGPANGLPPMLPPQGPV